MRKILFIPLLLASCETFAQNFAGLYTFANVTTTSGLIDPTPPPIATGLTFGSFSATGTPANPNANGRFSFVNWPIGATNANDNFSSLTGSVNSGEYYEVTLTPSIGYSIDLAAITFTVQRSSFGIRTWVVRSSIDGYSSNLNASINPANLNLSVQGIDTFFWNFDAITTAQNGSTITLGGPNFSALTSPVTFRIYGFNSELGTGTFSIDNVAFGGTANALTILAGFSVSPQPACEGSTISFTDNSQSFNGPITTWSWDFGDPASGPSNTSNAQNPTHVFSGCGTYNVTLIVINSNSNSDTALNPVFILCAPVPNFTGTPLTGCGTTCVNFTDGTTGTPVAWSWDFGDLATSTLQSPQHCYITPGTYSVSLNVTDANGCSASVPMPNYITIYPAVIADFSFTTTGLTANFTDLTSGGTPAFTYTFDPGDGSPPTPFIPPSYNYPFDNNWMACLTVTDANGCTDTTCHFVNIITTGMIEGSPDNFSVYPNPSSDGNFHLRSDLSNAGVEVFNSIGEKIYSGKNSGQETVLDLSREATGIYSVHVISAEGSFSKKISVRK